MKEKYDEDNKIVSMEWRDKKPFSATVSDGQTEITYDVEYTITGQGCYHWSCSGPSGPIKGYNGLFRLPKKIRTMTQLIRHFDLIDGEVVWCSKCKGWIYTDNAPGHEHFESCDDCGWYHEKGADC
jgi:hypothetical protein